MGQIRENDLRDMRKYGESVSGPIVYAYTEWVLCEAKRRGIERLWFLARDGYLPYLVARRICLARGLHIDCRYLYCSRRSLRSASYHLISDDEISSHIFAYGYCVSTDSLLERLDIGEERRSEIKRGLNIERTDAPLSREELSAVCDAIRTDPGIFDIIRTRSAKKYDSAIAYFRSVGVLDCDTVATVDSGWTGSVQHSMRILLDSVGYRGRLIGFYFGMYRDADDGDGEHLTYYFSAREGFLRRTFFNNNLLECMLSAPHPMTEKYAFIEDVPMPCFWDIRGYDMHLMVLAQISGALCYTDIENAKNQNKYTAEMRKRRIARIVRKAMISPSRRDAELLSHFMFCDDITEKYTLSLADSGARRELRNYMIIRRILRRAFRVPKARAELLWPYGAAAHLPRRLRLWYRLNLLVWDILKSARQSLIGIFGR